MSIPLRIGRYKILEPLGQGGFAEVFLAEDPQLGGEVAIKVLKTRAEDDPELHERFLAEARSLRKAESERVVRVYDIGELADGRPYLVMEYANAGTLENRLTPKHRQSPRPATGSPNLDPGASWLEPAVTLRYGAEIARGVAALHQVRVAHRDIKPSNVLFHESPSAGERLMIADLGVCKDLTDTRGYTRGAGTAGYMAPEQGIGIDITDRVDLYGIAAVVYRALTGQVPAPGAPIPPSRLHPGLPPGTDKVLLRALTTNPQDRHTSAEELAQAFDQLAHTAAQPPRTPPRRWALLATAATAAVAMALGVSWYLTQPTSSDPPAAAGSASPSATATQSQTRVASPSLNGATRDARKTAPPPTTSVPTVGRYCAMRIDTKPIQFGCDDDSESEAQHKLDASSPVLVLRLHSGYNYSGSTLAMYASEPCTSAMDEEDYRVDNLADYGWDNRASSLSTYNECRIKMHDPSDYGSPSYPWYYRQNDLRYLSRGDWDERLSSLRLT